MADRLAALHRCRKCGAVYPLILGLSATAPHGPDKSCKARSWEQTGPWEPLDEPSE